ncbi:hypothetical protein CN524_19785, partial [Bacillus sp. AFS019443]
LFILHSRDLDVEKLKWIYITAFLLQKMILSNAVENYFLNFLLILKGFLLLFAKHLYNNFFIVLFTYQIGSGGVLKAFPIQ